MANIHDVARKAQVSVATVSRVLNKSSAVSFTTKIKVEQAITELNYEPSTLGRNLRKLESRLLLVMIPSISNPFYTDVIKGIEDTAINLDYNILLCQTNSNPKRESIYFNLIKNHLADGIISMDPTVNKKNLMDLAENHPIIQCSEYDIDGSIAYTTINNELAAYHAIRYLIKIGHTKIALLNSDEKFLYARERRQGYERALREFGIELDQSWMYNAESLGFEGGQQAMRQLLTHSNRPTAVFAVSDILAIGALNEIHASGLHIPKDIALVGFDNISFSTMTHPTLTTISQPMFKMGCMAANMIINKIQGKKVESIILDHDLVIREST